MKKIRALIIDDEPIARTGIRRELERAPDVEIIGECTNGREAIAAIQEEAPDLVFLDLQMPELDGLGVIEAVGVDSLPVVVFVTAYDKFAVQAFEVHALDYILKPFSSDRFQKTLQRARTQVQRQNLDAVSTRLLSLIEDARRQPPSEEAKTLERIVVKTAGRIFFLNVEEIDWIEAADNYVCLHVGKDAHLVSGTMTGLETRLDPEKFIRIHRSTIINLARVKELHPLFHGEYAIRLSDDTELTSSRGYRERIQRLLENGF